MRQLGFVVIMSLISSTGWTQDCGPKKDAEIQACKDRIFNAKSGGSYQMGEGMAQGDAGAASDTQATMDRVGAAEYMCQKKHQVTCENACHQALSTAQAQNNIALVQKATKDLESCKSKIKDETDQADQTRADLAQHKADLLAHQAAVGDQSAPGADRDIASSDPNTPCGDGETCTPRDARVQDVSGRVPSTNLDAAGLATQRYGTGTYQSGTNEIRFLRPGQSPLIVPSGPGDAAKGWTGGGI